MERVVKKYVLALLVMVPLWPASVAAQTELLYQYPFIQASAEGDLATVNSMIRRGAKINQVHPDKTTALLEAAKAGHQDVVRVLLQHKAWPEFKDASGSTALSYAAERGHAGVVYELIQARADAETYDGQGLTPLIKAARNGRVEVVRLLIGARVDVNRTDYAGISALEWARRNRWTAIVQDLQTVGAQ
jgi:ankyrin repeat protein